MAEFPQSREEAILQATINGEEYTGYPESRIEELLLELKAVIESGGGGGGTTNYNFLENKPQIGGVTLTGDKSASDLSLASTSRLADAENMVCAEFFDASKAYTKDTYVIYNDGLYKFKSAHTAGAAWDASIVDEVDLLTVIQEATNPTIDPPVLNKESVVSENDVNTLSANFTAQSTSQYMIILAIAGDTKPVITSVSVTVNNVEHSVADYYASDNGMNSKYALLDLEAGDAVAASITSSIEAYGTSVSIALVKLSYTINGLTLKDSASTNSSLSGDLTIQYNVEKDAVYLLWFFNRSNGVGAFKTLKKNNTNITSNKIICSSGSGWQVSHGMCMVYAKTLDIFNIAIQFNEYFDAVGIFEVLADNGESYNDLKDKPQIGGVTLTGNKTASQLGLVASEQGKGLSTNDYTTAEKSKLATVQNGANKKHKKLYTLDKNNWREITPGSGHYVYDLLITNPMLSIQDTITMYYGEYHNSYEDPYFDDSKWNVYKNIYMGEYGSSVDDPPASAHLYFCDPMTMHAPTVSINVYIEGIVYEG